MKLKKVSGNLLTGLGCTVTLIGLAAYVLPKINNRQLKLVLSSFRSPSNNPLIQLMNNGMNFAMEHCFMMILLGCGIMMTGILLCISVRTDEEVQAARNARIAKTAARANAPAPADAPYQRPQGMARPVATVHTEEDNPFARYIAEGSLPRRTLSRSSEKPAATPVLEPAQTAPADDILLTFDTADHTPPEQPAVINIQPTPEENHHIHMRPAVQMQPEEPAVEAASQPQAVMPVQAAPAAPEPMMQAAPAANKPVPARPAPAADQPPAQRPMIRSTFRKLTPVQPEQHAPESVPEKSAVQPTLAPASRIKSTMGHKV